LRAKRSNPEAWRELDCFVAIAPRNDDVIQTRIIPL
jgi:hypothetical protein